MHQLWELCNRLPVRYFTPPPDSENCMKCRIVKYYVCHFSAVVTFSQLQEMPLRNINMHSVPANKPQKTELREAKVKAKIETYFTATLLIALALKILV
jgi:hypothetical protein